MNPPRVEQVMKTLTVLVDTREQDTTQFRRRMEAMQLPFVRKKLDFGDYSCRVSLGGRGIDLSGRVAIERKMSLDELAQCYTKGRRRFEREFERAKAAGAKLYLLIEDADWERAYAGRYRSRLHPHALTASMLAWLARYDCQILLCAAETTPRLIRDILYREARERLEAMPDAAGL